MTPRRLLFVLTGLVIPLTLNACSSGSSTGPGNGGSVPVRFMWQHPLPQGDFVVDAHMFSADRWVIAAYSGWLRTDDAGATWQYRMNPPGKHNGKMAFLDALNGFMVAFGGRVARTSDGGATWRDVNVASGVLWSSVSWPAGGTIILTSATGGVYRSTDAGTTWNMVDRFLLAQDTWFFDETHGVAVGNIGIYRTDDGGATWTSIGGSPETLFGVHFADDTRGVAVGRAGTIHVSRDGGQTFPQQTPTNTTANLIDVYMADVNNVVAVGGPTIVLSVTGGNAWNEIYTHPGALQLGTVTFADASNGLVGGAGGIILQTKNSGVTWSELSTGVSASTLSDVGMAGPNVVYAVGYGGTILKSTDGGTTWQAQNTGSLYPISSIDVIDEQTAVAVTQQDGVIRTQDGGATWAPLLSGVYGSYRASFADADNGWLIRAGSFLLHTADGGTNWTTQGSHPSTFDDYDVCALTSQIAYTCGENGSIYKTTDTGANWTALTSHTSENLMAIDFVDADHGVAAGTGDVFLWTVDGGQTWDVTAKPTTDETKDVHMVSSTTAWTVGRYTGYTTDRGATWTEVATGIADGPTAIDFGSADVATLVGPAGAILRSTNAGR